MASPVLGVGLHAVGGLAAGSFYLPFKGVRQWAWESFWIVGGFFSWVVTPLTVAYLTTPQPFRVILESPPSSVFFSFILGILWGIGGLTFGLSMRYLGMSLGYAVALGFCAAFGTLIPPLVRGEMGALMSDASGQFTLLGVLVCLGGIAICGRAGMLKEQEVSQEEKQAVIKEFNFSKGMWIAFFCGILSACMSFAISVGAPVAQKALELGAPELFQNSPLFIVIFAGGFLTNVIWCAFLNVRNKTGGDYLDRRTPLLRNYTLSAAAGIIWYCQFMFYGMGSTQLGVYDFSSWTLHMAFIIVFSNLWGLMLREWRGASPRTLAWITAGLLVLVGSTVVVGIGNWLEG